MNGAPKKVGGEFDIRGNNLDIIKALSELNYDIEVEASFLATSGNKIEFPHIKAKWVK